MKSKLNLKLYKRYFIKVLFSKLVDMMILLMIVIIMIIMLTIYLYLTKDNEVINVINDLEIYEKEIDLNKDSFNIIKKELNKFLDLFKDKNYKSGIYINMNEYVYPSHRSENLTKYPVNNELNDFCFSIYKENAILKDKIYALKLQASEYESIGKFSIKVMDDFNKF
jgi:hypothetical protein